MERDQIYALPRDRVGDFTFDDTVASVFPDMIARSVPGYASILSMIEQLTIRFAKPNTNIYDLGCSLGAGTFLIRNQAPLTSRIVAVDNSAAMVTRLEGKLQELSDSTLQFAGVQVLQQDINEVEFDNASFVILNWTLQFVPAEQRDALLSKICQAMIPGGALLLSEKIMFNAPGQQQLLTDLHHDFKRANGYSELEIAQKRTSLENRLIPETTEVHLERLHRVGFQIASTWFQCFNFVSFLAVR